jgi:hypothetical protein
MFGVLFTLLLTATSTIRPPGVLYGTTSAAVVEQSKNAFDSGIGVENLPPKQTVKVSRYISGIAQYVPVATGDFNDVNNCGPTACVNLLKYWHDVRGKQTLEGGSVKTAYKKICNLTKFKASQGMGNTYGYTGLQAYADKFCQAAGGDYLDSAPLSWIKRNIDHNNMVILIIKAANYSPGMKGYHFVNCLGYYQPLKSNAVYLQIVDGWDHSAIHYYNAKYGNVSAFYLRW